MNRDSSRITGFICTVILCGSISACGSTQAIKSILINTEETSTASSATSQIDIESKADTEENIPIIEHCVYQAIDSESEISIAYPIITGLMDSVLEESINDALYRCATDIYISGDGYNPFGLYVEADYRVTLVNADKLSVVFFGEPYAGGTAHPTKKCFAMNIQMKTGRVQSLSDVCSFDKLGQAFEKGYVDYHDGIHELYFERESFEWFRAYVAHPIVYGDTVHAYDFYIDAEFLYLIVSVSHANGDYLTIRVALDRIQD
jgi:hypothetical protein